ncbi:MAG TPA: outer membrane beta-barrel protein [Anaeromyxobacteraceae bacterium]|nr:outer membrane beta-barrel protein [Anaeromyxobacteraceae bacterium]
MFKRMLLVLVALAPTLARAEIEAGTIELGGSSRLALQTGSVKASGTPTSDQTELALDAGGLYYVTPMIGIGAELLVDRVTDKTGGVSSTFTQTGIGPKIGIDVPLSHATSFFGEAMVGWASRDLDGAKSSGAIFGLTGGLKFFPASALSLDVGLRLQHTEASPSGSGATVSFTSFGLVLGLSGYVNAR